jgi:hypothetical protein
MNISAVRIFLTAAVVFPALCCFSAFAQQGTAALNGSVTDSSGLAVPAAKVVAVNSATNINYTAETNEAGLYNLPAIPAGTYQMTVTKDGFQQAVRPNIELHVSDVITLNFPLTVGSLTQTVTVDTSTPMVETTASSLGGLVNDAQIADLPLNGRNYIDLSLLQAGVQQNTSTTTQIGGMAGTTYSVNGVSMLSNNFLLDGTQIGNQSGWGTASFAGTTLGVDGIKEYKVLTSAFDASYGMAMGSQMVMISKGGGNQFHGDIFEYFRNSDLNAKNFFDSLTAPIPHLEKNNYGASFGGPIKKDKMFFYAVYEGLKETLGFTAVDTVPAAGCHGLTGQAGDVIWNGQGTQPANSSVCPQLGSNPNLGLPAGATNNYVTIHNSQIASMLSLYPNPTNASVNQYRFSPPTLVTANYGQNRFDYDISPSDIFFARYTIDQSVNNAASNQATPTTSGTAFPQFRGGGTTLDQFITASETHILTPALSNTVRLSFSRTGWHTFWVNGPGGSAIPSFPGGPGFLAGAPFESFAVTGLTAVGFGGNAGPPSTPSVHLQNIYSIADDVYYTHGKHQMRFGVLLNRFNQALTVSSVTSYGDPTYGSLANFLQAVPLSFGTFLPGGITIAILTTTRLGFMRRTTGA